MLDLDTVKKIIKLTFEGSRLHTDFYNFLINFCTDLNFFCFLNRLCKYFYIYFSLATLYMPKYNYFTALLVVVARPAVFFQVIHSIFRGDSNKIPQILIQVKLHMGDIC